MNVQSFLRRYTIVPILMFFLLLGCIFIKDFLSPGNFMNILLQATLYGVMSIGMTFLMINSYYDLSVGMVMCLSANLVVGLQPQGMGFAIVAALLMGIVVGTINGFLVAKAKINAFIVTLAAMQGLRGVVYIYTKEDSVVGIVKGFEVFGASKLFGISTLTWILFALLFLGEFILRRTNHGRNTFATGGNELAARNAGINTDSTTIINFIVCAFMAAVGGVLQASRLNAATPILGWPDTNMMIIACVVLGGTKLSGGFGGMFYTLGGVLTICTIQNEMNLLGLQSYYKTLTMGIVLISIVLLDKYFRPNVQPQRFDLSSKKFIAS